MTHECQRPPEQVRREALDFIEYARPKLVGPNRDPCFILKMDQTPIFFDMSSQQTLSALGERTTVIGRTLSLSIIGIMTGVCNCDYSGMLLKPLIVFKGKPGTRIETQEFSTSPQDNFYACQDHAWMDEQVMQLWVCLDLKPYVEEAPPGVQLLILLDSYCCHMMASVVNAINDLGVQIETTPGGYTGLCQQIDFGIDKPLKSQAQHLWEERMINEGVDNAVLCPPSCLLLTHWKANSVQLIHNSTPSMF